jgi:hypothetical protein
MKIELRKFGEVLTSRPAGREAFAAIRPTLDPNARGVQIDFTGILSLYYMAISLPTFQAIIRR